MFTVTGITGAVGAAAPTGAGVVRTTPGVVGAAPRTFAVLRAPGALAFGAAARPTLFLGAASALVVGAAGPLSLGPATPALGARAPFGTGLIARGAGSAGTRRGLVVSPEAAFGIRSASSARTLFPGRASGPAPSAVAARTVVRALGPATAAFGTPSSFGTHVVLDCLSRPVGLTIPWWKRGMGPPGGSVIRDLWCWTGAVQGPVGPVSTAVPVVQGLVKRRPVAGEGFQQVAKTLAATSS